MKLNLLPSKVSTESSRLPAILTGVALAVFGILAMLAMIMISNKNLSDAKRDAVSQQQAAANAVATAQAAETQMAAAATIIRNQRLAEAMLVHNYKYVDLYNDVLDHVPSYYRLISIQAVPSGPMTTVTLTGQLQTYAQYADLAIAMWKIPDAVQVVRSGYEMDEMTVPTLTEQDQSGMPRRPGQEPLPPYRDISERIDALVQRAADAPRGFQDSEGFGTGPVAGEPRGPLAGYSTVTMTISLNRNMQVPNPRATVLQPRPQNPGQQPNQPAPGFNQMPANNTPGGR